MTYIFEDRKGHRIYVYSQCYRMDEESGLNMYWDGTLRDYDKESDIAARKARYIAKHPNK